MGRGSRAMARRRRPGSKAARASASGVSGLSKEAGLSAVSPRVLFCGAASLVSPASYADAAGKGRQSASESEAGDSGLAGLSAPCVLGRQAAEEEGKILKHESEEGGKILQLDSLKLDAGVTLDDRQNRILMPDSEEDLKILMAVKSEEGKILKLKKEFVAASLKALEGVSMYIDLPMLEPSMCKKMKERTEIVVVKTLVSPEQIAFLKAMPCPVTSPVFNLYSEEDLAYETQEFQDYFREKMSLNIKMRDYYQALIDQYDKFGYAVDETELTELTDDEDEDEENALKN